MILFVAEKITRYKVWDQTKLAFLLSWTLLLIEFYFRCCSSVRAWWGQKHRCSQIELMLPTEKWGESRCSASLVSSAVPSESTNMRSIITRYERLASPPNGYLLRSECGLTACRPRDQEVGYRRTLDSWLSQSRLSPSMSFFWLGMAVRGQPALETKPWGVDGKLLTASFSVGANEGLWEHSCCSPWVSISQPSAIPRHQPQYLSNKSHSGLKQTQVHRPMSAGERRTITKPPAYAHLPFLIFTNLHGADNKIT